MSLDICAPRTQIARMANGKGDLRRPAFIPEHELGRRWQETFGNSRLPSNPAVARSEIEAASGAQAETANRWDGDGNPVEPAPTRGMNPAEMELFGQAIAAGRIFMPFEPLAVIKGDSIRPDHGHGPASCSLCGEPANQATKCHRASWQKNPGPRRK